jgi:NAD(P)-dependent dehydrogenase (short-subunit alcohol dehydrogenase family)
MELKNKVALITGGARIGITVAEELAKNGCHVALSFRISKEAAQKAAKKVTSCGSKALVVQGNMTKESDVRNVVNRVGQHFGRLDILINMVSIYKSTPWSTLTEEIWEENIQANLKSTFLTVLHAAPLIKKQRGRIINFADWVAASGRPRYKDFIPYYTSKMGIVGLTQSQALDLAPHVLVNTIAPGPIVPPKDLPTEETQGVSKVTPLKKWGGAKEIAKAVLFLIQTDFVTGECIRVDGGRHLF